MRKTSLLKFLSCFVLTIYYFVSQPASAQCVENFDGVTAPSLPSGWSAVTLTTCTGSNKWVTSTTTASSTPNAAFVTSPGCVSDEILISPYYAINSNNPQLTFQRKHGLENNYDGLVLEVSVDGGSFIDILAAGAVFSMGGYNGLINATTGNPLGGRQAWTGSTSNLFVTTTIDLPSSWQGRIIVFRWRRGTDISVADAGAYIDNISVQGCTITPCSQNFDALTVPALPAGWISYTAIAYSGSNPWVTVNSQAQTAPNSVFVNSTGYISDEYLYSSIFRITSPTAQITFQRNNDLEFSYDGMVLEISIGGAPFKDILLAGCSFVTGAYDYVINCCYLNPLAGRSAWTGNSVGWVTTIINLPSSAFGKNIILRWRRGTDVSFSGIGAYIDGLSISGSLCPPDCATSVTLSPAGSNLCSSSSVLLTASLTGSLYEWYRNDVLISGITGSSYTATEGGIYYVKTFSGCWITSNVAVIESAHVVPELNGTGAYCEGAQVNLEINNSQPDQLYSIKKNEIVIYGPLNGTGGTLSYSFTMEANKAGDYIVESTKSGCVEIQKDTAFIREPETVTGLTVVNNCSNEVLINWNRILPDIANQNYEYVLSQSSVPPVSGTQITDTVITLPVSPSTFYYFYIRYYCSSTVTMNWSVISFTSPSPGNISLSPVSGNICNNSITLTASGSSGEYEWYKNGTLINGASNSTFDANSGGVYMVKLIENGCATNSNTSVISEATMAIPSLGGAGVYCTGDFADLSSTTVPTQEYSWFKNGALVYGPIGGGNGGNQSLNILVNEFNEGTYQVKSSKAGCGDVNSNFSIVREAKVKGLKVTSICSDNASLSWNSVAFGANYQYVLDQNSTPPTNPVNPIVTPSVTVNVNPLIASTTYYFHIRAAKGPDFTQFCENWTSISFTTEATALPAGTAEWTGATDTDWQNTSNWKCGQIPDASTEVIINGGRSNYPIITGNITIKKLIVNAGASVHVNPGVNLIITAQ